ncbi:SDR family oxidoreductase [Streptomyces sp. NPDC006134]|uniref:SDR family oxidoreductase n=1 Tax=Streptomyces sp. NPDC006134 TaxID=3154467 RepID=UPI0033FE8C13
MSILLTGATGFLGSRIAHLLLTTRARSVIALGRGEPSALRGRVLRALGAHGGGMPGEQVRGRLWCVSGDVTQPWLGLSPALYRRLAQDVDAVWHCAGDIALSGERERLHRVNVHGTAQVLEFAATTARQCRMVHVSTMAVAGARPDGHVLEDELDDSYGFETHYDASKFAAEQLVRRWARQHGRPVVVLRPSIVASASASVSVSPEEAAGHPLSVLGQMIEAVARGGAPGIPARRPDGTRLRLRLPAAPQATFNIVPDTYATEAMVRIGHDGSHRGATAHTYHVVHPEPTPIARLIGAIEQRYPGLRIECAGGPLPDATEAERFVAAHLTGFLSYSRHTRTYDRTRALAATAGLPGPEPIGTEFLQQALGLGDSSVMPSGGALAHG